MRSRVARIAAAAGQRGWLVLLAAGAVVVALAGVVASLVAGDDAAVIRLAGAVLLETHDEWQTADRAYFSEGSMAQLTNLSDDDPAKEVTHDDQHR